MEEKTEKKTETRRNALTIGIGSRETADRFLAIKGMGTYEEALVLLLNAYDHRSDNGAEAGLKKRIEDLESENRAYQATLENNEAEIADLNTRLEAAIADANANAESGLGKQLQLDELQQRTEGAIIIKPNPVVRHFLNAMAEKTGSTPERILEELFLADLQNPRANNLPYTVTSRDIRQVMNELKPQQQ